MVLMKQIKGIVATTTVIINTVILVTILMFFAVLKLVIPIGLIKNGLSKLLILIAESWISVNSKIHQLLHGEKYKLVSDVILSKDEWYLVVANHQTSSDIPIIQGALNKKIPFLKFFLKQELIWVPFLGLAWWALDFPFMKRYSKEYLLKHPHLKGKDMEQTQKSCQKFKNFPTSVINFIEGTRFTQQKHKSQNSPYQNLLKPKAGGIGFVMGSMGTEIKQVLLLTVAYSPKPPTLWQYLCGDFEEATVFCEKFVIPEHLLGKNYQIDEKFKTELFKWSENLWYKQDDKLKEYYERSDI